MNDQVISQSVQASAHDIPRPEEIARTYGPMVSALCFRMIRNREKAEDAAQEIWIEVLGALKSFRGESKFSTWLYTVARRTIMREIEKEKTYSTRFLSEYFSLMSDEGMPQMEKIPDADRLQWILTQCDDCMTAIMHCLDKETRILYLFRVLTPLSYDDIAEIFEKNAAAVRQSVSRAARKINSFLNEECYLYNPGGTCRCKIKAPIVKKRADAEFRTYKKLSKSIMFIRRVEDFYHRKNLWMEHFKKMVENYQYM